MNKDSLVGITGAFGSGKSTAAAFFAAKGFRKIVLSAFLEGEARKRGVDRITRKVLQDIGNEWRKRYGSRVLAKKALVFLKEDRSRKIVIDGIRNTSEIDELRKHDDFTLIAVIADRKVRFERLRKLQRRESLTWDLFTKLDRRDLGLGQRKTGLQVAQCIAMADTFIENNRSINEFKGKLDNFFKNL